MARDHSGKRLAPHVFEAVSWEAMKAAIFEHCAPHIQNRASYVDDPRVWTVSENAPTNEDFENFITIKMGRNAFRPTSSALAHRYLSDHVNQRFIIVVFKWGNQIVNSNDLQQFHEQCVQVPVRDRSGAAAESLHQATGPIERKVVKNISCIRGYVANVGVYHFEEATTHAHAPYIIATAIKHTAII
ncbi:hypothetical protein LEN26_008943 [Aphanomyces euteiches]|nr:hypothetical protein AeMF1_012285 [Aphanomyces euteiches]KAH9130004.1 hypothetical protein LEN26_008943 [Aphanomyces euteiches]KAH9185121.1 hypothetical protein AeNC1_012902 [Aphanomyces euteiches]